jgi:hypothetical protein
MLKKGDRVLVWSLQSFHYGGFLKGEPAFVRQNQNTGDSVILCVIRNKRGVYEIDASYEVYVQQVVKVKKKDWSAEKRLKKFRKKIMKNQFGIRKWEST